MQNPNTITVYAANCRGNAANCLYPNRIEITDEASAVAAFSQDIVCAEYRNNYRSIGNFLGANALPMDCDNDHSDDSALWITEDDIARFFPDVPYIIHYSRHHMKPKGNRSARPRFHVIFLIDLVTDPDAYVKLKQRLVAAFPFFDTNAVDAARFLFGTEDPQVLFHPGTITLNIEEKEAELELLSGMIRNCVMMNASASLTEQEYQAQYTELSQRYESTKAGYEALLERRKQMEATAIVFSGILFRLAELPQIPMEFNETLWHTLVDHVTVYSDERIVFTFTDGTEIVTML